MFKTDIVFSKTRVSPTYEFSIPRLELVAVLIAVSAIAYVKKQLHIPVAGEYLWTDAKCVLQWIAMNKALTTFVQNRIDEIKQHKEDTFGHVQSKDNPADIASRDTTTQEL